MRSVEPAIFTTDRLTVRRWTLDDADAAFAVYRDPEVWRYINGKPGDVDIEESRARLAMQIERYRRFPGFGSWAITVIETGEIIGACLLKPLEDGQEIEVGYHLKPSAWGQGYATEVAQGAIGHGFSELGLQRIAGVVNPANHASARVLEKAGLRFEGIRHYYGIDVRYFAIAASAWAEAAPESVSLSTEDQPMEPIAEGNRS